MLITTSLCTTLSLLITAYLIIVDNRLSQEVVIRRVSLLIAVSNPVEIWKVSVEIHVLCIGASNRPALLITLLQTYPTPPFINNYYKHIYSHHPILQTYHFSPVSPAYLTDISLLTSMSYKHSLSLYTTFAILRLSQSKSQTSQWQCFEIKASISLEWK